MCGQYYLVITAMVYRSTLSSLLPKDTITTKMLVVARRAHTGLYGKELGTSQVFQYVGSVSPHLGSKAFKILLVTSRAQCYSNKILTGLSSTRKPDECVC